MNLMRRRGQSVTEYVVVISVVAAAVIGMQIFVKRGLQAKQKDVTDHYTNAGGDIASLGVDLAKVAQYEPYYSTEGTYRTEIENKAFNERMLAQGQIRRIGIDETTTRTGGSQQKVDLTQDDAWIRTPR